MNTSSIKETFLHFLHDVWNEGNIDASDKYIAPSYTIHHDPGDPWDKQTLTLAQYKDRVRISRAPFPDQCFTVQELFVDGNTLIATWTWAGTHNGVLPGSPASGKHITMSGITVYYFDSEHFTGHWQVVDRLGVYQQLRQ
jgi:predicted ester cyclase